MKIKNVIRIMIVSSLLLLVPLAAKIFMAEMAWSMADFVIVWFLLFSTGFIYKLITNKATNTMYRIAAGSAVATGLLLMWVNLAVGLIGNENNPANLMYFGVIAVGFIGAIIARFQPRGMMRVLFATALSQALVPVIAMIIWKPPFNIGVIQVLGVNAFFVMLWIGSALLFRRASASDSK